MEDQAPRKKRKINLTEISLAYFNGPEIRKNEKGEDKQMYKCKHCQSEINGTKASNLSKHLQHHEELFLKICNIDSIEKKRLKLLLDCVELVAVNGNTFSRLQDSGLLSMLEKTLIELQEAVRSVNLTDSHNSEVKKILLQTSKNIQQKIREELHNRSFSLMVDITTKRRRSILGVSAQYIMNGKHTIHSLGMLELKESHTGEYLAKVICEMLSEYDVKPRQMIAITTDNGGNVVKMVRSMTTQMVAIESANQTALFHETNENTPSCDDEIENYLQDVPDYTDEQALNILFDHAESEDEIGDDIFEEHNILLNAMTSSLQNSSGLDFVWTIAGIRCAAHTLQLAINDALISLQKVVKNVITLSRRISKTMRLKSTAHQLKLANIKYSIPRLDVETRWCSTYTMVRKILCVFFNKSI